MDPKRVELLAERVRAAQESKRPHPAIKKHLDAARAKLEYLKASRHQLKKDLDQVTAERDEALRELQHLKTRRGPRAITPCDLHETVIDQLQTERAFLLQSLEDVLDDLTNDTADRVDLATDRARESLDVLQRLDKAS